MEMMIDFPGGSRVDAHFGPFTVATDQPPASSAPSPFDVFLSSIGTCVGIYILSFCTKHDLSIEEIRIFEKIHTNPTSRMVEKIDLEIQVPSSFPKEHYASLVRSANLCKVKKQLAQPPSFDVYTKVTD